LGRGGVLESPGDDRLTIASPSGRIELSVRFTAEGPVLEFDSDTGEVPLRGLIDLRMCWGQPPVGLDCSGV